LERVQRKELRRHGVISRILYSARKAFARFQTDFRQGDQGRGLACCDVKGTRGRLWHGIFRRARSKRQAVSKKPSKCHAFRLTLKRVNPVQYTKEFVAMFAAHLRHISTRILSSGLTRLEAGENKLGWDISHALEYGYVWRAHHESKPIGKNAVLVLCQFRVMYLNLMILLIRKTWGWRSTTSSRCDGVHVSLTLIVAIVMVIQGAHRGQSLPT